MLAMEARLKSLTKRAAKGDVNAAAQAVLVALAKDQPGMAGVHVDTPMGGQGAGGKKPKKPPKAPTVKARFIKQDVETRYTLGVVYEPDTLDSQDDFAIADEIEHMCWDFNRHQIGTGRDHGTGGRADKMAKAKLIRKGALGIQHQDWSDTNGDIVESYIQRVDCEIGGQPIKAGTWLMGTIWAPDIWEKIKSGEITGLSMGGTATRTPVQTQ